MADPLILARLAHLAATLLAGGTVSFMLLVVLPPFAAKRPPAGFAALRHQLMVMAWIALVVAIGSGLAWLLLLTIAIHDAPLSEVGWQGLWQVTTETRFGLVWGLRFVLALLLSGLIYWKAARWPAIAAATLFVALLATVGHSGASPGVAGGLQLAADMVHLLAAGAWLGGLPALVLLLARARASATPAWRSTMRAAVSRFSLLGMVCVGALLASGVANSWYLLAGPRDLLTTDYGQLLSIKIGLFTAMTCIAAVNRYRLTPKLPARAAMQSLQRNTIVETGLGLAVLLIVGALGTMAPVTHMHNSSAEIPPNAAQIHIHTPQAMADITFDPERAGRSKVTIRLLREDYAVFAAKIVRLVLDPEAAGVQRVEHETRRMDNGTWQTDSIEIPQRGIWRVRVFVSPELGTPIELDARIVIE